MVIMMMLVMSVNPVAAVVSQPGIVVSPVIRIATVLPIRIIPVIPWIAVLAVPVGWVTESDSYSSDSIET
jgi:hypothetical protein